MTKLQADLLRDYFLSALNAEKAALAAAGCGIEEKRKAAACRHLYDMRVNQVNKTLQQGVVGEFSKEEITAYQELLQCQITPEEFCRVLGRSQKPNIILIKNIYEFYELNKYSYE